MKYERSEQYKGFLISGKASSSFTLWQSLVTLRKATCRTEAMGVAPLCETAQGAVDQTLHAAKLMIDSEGFSLQVAAGDGVPTAREPL